MTAGMLPGEPAEAPERKRNPLVAYLSRFDDGSVVRWAFRGLLIGTIGVLATDLYEMSGRDLTALYRNLEETAATPILPPAVDLDAPAGSTDPRPFVTTHVETLGRPMTFTLERAGRLVARGSIEPGTADRLGEELAARGEYVTVLVMDSPGGALQDAMAMARLVRERRIATEVGDGGLCASSCPLVLAGGTERRVGAQAAVGVHQFYAAIADGVASEQVMADAQATTAKITRHLTAMGVDPALWLHALDTPPRSLYYFSPEELSRYRLVTEPVAKAAAG